MRDRQTDELGSNAIPLSSRCGKNLQFSTKVLEIRSHPEMVGDISHVTLNFDLSKIPFVHF